MKKILSLLLICLWVQVPTAQSLELGDIRNLWINENYLQVITELLKYRDADFGKTVEVDYMLATSFCRHPGDDDLGRAFLLNILQVYELSSENREKIIYELSNCPEERQPEQLAFLTSRSTGGLDAGIRGKMFYFVDGPNRAIGGDPLEVNKEISAGELEARRFVLGDSSAAAAAMATRLSNIGFSPNIYASDHFLIGSMSNHSTAEMQEIARLLEKALNFYVSSYKVRAPATYLSVYLVPDSWQLRSLGNKLHGLKVASGTIGYSFRNDLSVSAVVQGPYTGTLKHELTHLLVRSNFGDIPPWLDEGLAALYEVSRLEGNYLRGLPNWRGELLKRFWGGQPKAIDLLGMNWQQFDAYDGAMKQQAIHHALARYWVLFLQDRGYLPAVYNTYRTRDIRQITAIPNEDSEKLFVAATGKDLTALDTDFVDWYQELSRSVTNAEVKELQRRLTLLGYSPGAVDGLAGANTIKAVKAFQRDNGFDVDGQIDTVLLGRIKEIAEE